MSTLTIPQMIDRNNREVRMRRRMRNIHHWLSGGVVIAALFFAVAMVFAAFVGAA